MEKIKANHRPLILVTNDDGVEAKGIHSLIEAVRPFGDVVVVAPDQAMSGMSHAITVKHPLYLTKVQEEPGLQIFKSNGTPADCVKLAVNVLLADKPAFVVSGINHGTNSSVSMHYSGTLGGAREGVLNGIPAIGFSLLAYEADADFSSAIHYSRAIFEQVLEQGLPKGETDSESGEESEPRYARVPTLSEVFNLEGGQFGLVTAAIFGLTPGLLVERLRNEGEKYKADLQSTGAQGNR